MEPIRAKDRFLVFGAPAIETAEIDEVVDSLRKAWLGTGPKVAKFEAAFRDYLGASHAIAVNSCTAALHLSLLCLDLADGDEVITTPMTFCATVNAILHAGGTPVLADVDPTTRCLDPECVRAKLTSRTRAILPVHFAGHPAPMDELVALAKEHGLELVEDCAHAIEAQHHGRKMGTFGRFGCFSFYATKNVTTGEGGMVVARDERDAQRLKVLALHGMSKDAWHRFDDKGYQHYEVTEAGYKYNMMDLQAAIGIHQLARVEASWVRRQQIWGRYLSELSDLPLTLSSPVAAGSRHACHLFTLLVDSTRSGLTRDGFLRGMTEQNIGVGVHYLSIPEHPYYQVRFGWRPEDYPNAMQIGRQTASIPLSPALTDRDVDDVVAAVRRVVSA